MIFQVAWSLPRESFGTSDQQTRVTFVSNQWWQFSLVRPWFRKVKICQIFFHVPGIFWSGFLLFFILIAVSNVNLCSGIKAWLDIVIIMLSGYACWMINDHSREIGFICKIVLFLFKSTAESWRQWWSVWFMPICGKFWPQLN